jgi:hypothetical protein
MKRGRITAAIGIALVLAAGGVTLAADELSAARDLYASAAYEEALAALNRVRAAGAPAADAFTVEQYRVFCLLALGRESEAQSAIEALVVTNPLYLPSPNEVSPRVRTAFSEVRRRLLPSLVPQQYAKAKAAFDKKDYTTAAAGFNQVLSVLSDPDVAQAAGQPPLSDLRTLATGFQELSTKAIPPPPLAAAPPPVVPTVSAQAPAPLSPPRVYTLSDTKVIAPVPIRQDLPSFSGRLSEPVTGTLEIVIDERGFVESSKIREPVNPSYDRLAVAATTSWRYRPAMLDGVPVKFRKLISVTLKPTS